MFISRKDLRKVIKRFDQLPKLYVDLLVKRFKHNRAQFGLNLESLFMDIFDILPRGKDIDEQKKTILQMFLEHEKVQIIGQQDFVHFHQSMTNKNDPTQLKKLIEQAQKYPNYYILGLPTKP